MTRPAIELIGEPATIGEAEEILRQLAGVAPRQFAEALFDAVMPPEPPAAAAPLPDPPHAPPPEPATPGRAAEPVLNAGLFRELFEALPDGVLLCGSTGRIALVNSRAEEMFGFRRDELLGRSVEILIPDRFRSRHAASFADYFKSPRVRRMGEGRQLFGRRKDGSEFPVEIGLSPLTTPEGTFVTATVRDVTSRERAESRLRTLIEQIPAVTFMASLDEGLNELYVSPQIENLLGFTQKEWVDDPILWYRQLHPDDQEHWHEEFALTVSGGKPFSSEYRFIARDGSTVWVRGEARLGRDRSGRPTHLQGVAFDITGMKRAEADLRALNETLNQRVAEATAELRRAIEELKRANSELERSNGELEKFGFFVAHELRRPLRPIVTYAQRLEKLGLDVPAADWVTRIVRNGRDMETLIDRMLLYARVGKGGREIKRVDCAAAVESACRHLSAAIEERGARISKGRLPTVIGDEVELVQLFENLINNGIKYNRSASVKVGVSAVRRDEKWEFRVGDNGIGIEPQYQEKIFDIFFRLHAQSEYPGTGIGLAFCRKVVERHGGTIWVESKPGKGSTFCFTLPAAPDDPAPFPPEAPRPKSRRAAPAAMRTRNKPAGPDAPGKARQRRK